MRNDAFDRLGTRLEHRFTHDDIGALMVRVGRERITFNDHAPYWCGVGYRRAT